MSTDDEDWLLELLGRGELYHAIEPSFRSLRARLAGAERQVAAIRAAEVKLADNGEAVRVIYHDQDGRQVVDLYPKEFTNRKGWESAERFAGWLRAALGVTPTGPGPGELAKALHDGAVMRTWPGSVCGSFSPESGTPCRLEPGHSDTIAHFGFDGPAVGWSFGPAGSVVPTEPPAPHSSHAENRSGGMLRPMSDPFGAVPVDEPPAEEQQ